MTDTTSSLFLRPSLYRCAVYFAPPVDSAWWAAGSQWLGRCAASGQAKAAPTIPGIDAALFSKLTAEPRRYGWHATLKAPFKLAPGQDVDSLLAGMSVLANGLKAFTLPSLEVSTLGGFLALRPRGDVSALNAVASTCVKGLHHLAVPLNEAELARRRQSGLTSEQDRLLVAWGYPWVMDHFQFHLSLTGPLDGLPPEQRDAIVRAADAHFGPLPACRFAHLSLFVEPTAGADFELRGSVRLPE